MSRPPHTWTNVHDPKLFNRNADEEADELANVFDIICEREDKLIETFHINLAGNQMTNVQTNDQLETSFKEQVVKTRNQYADPMDILAKHLPDASRNYHARLTNSLHWYLQSSVITSARLALINLYKKDAEKPHEEGTTQPERFKNFCLNISDTLMQPSMWVEGDLLTLAQKYKLMNEWGDQAMSAADADNRVYKPKTLIQMMLEEKPQAVRVETKANFELFAKHKFKKLMDQPVVYAAKVAEYVRLAVEREDLIAKDFADTNRGLIGYVETVIDCIGANQPAYVIFTSMDKRFQRGLVDFTVNSLDRIAARDIPKDRSVPTSEYMDILEAKDAAIEELEAFRKMYADESEDLEETTANRMSAKEEAHQRAQKALVSTEAGAAAVDAASKGEDPVKAAEGKSTDAPAKQTTADVPTQAPATPDVQSTKPANKRLKVGDVVKA
jgi:hypothetical protein